MSAETRRVLLFHRDFRVFTGGHLKVWHYFQHAGKSRRFVPRIYLTPESVMDGANPWHGVEPAPLPVWRPAEADTLFLAGLDWEAVTDPPPAPVINLIQGLRHGELGDPRRRYLERPAVRICVSKEVADAITATGIVNGPVHVIPNGIDLENIPSAGERDVDVLIAGLKNPRFAVAVAMRLTKEGIMTTVLTKRRSRLEFLHWLSRSRVVITLPHERDGFFLPALEAMATGAIVICPDCVGNRQYCRDGETCFRPAYKVEELVQAALKAVRLDCDAQNAMRGAAHNEARRHGLQQEQAAFLRILDTM